MRILFLDETLDSQETSLDSGATSLDSQATSIHSLDSQGTLLDSQETLLPDSEQVVTGLEKSAPTIETSFSMSRTTSVFCDETTANQVIKEVCAENDSTSKVLLKLMCANYVLAKENNSMLKHLCNAGQTAVSTKIRQSCPVNLPCCSENEVKTLNDFLKHDESRSLVMSFVGFLDSSSVRRTTYCAAAKLLTISAASGINWAGKSNKISMKHELPNVFLLIKMIVCKQHSQCAENEIVDALQRWLKKSPCAMRKKSL